MFTPDTNHIPVSIHDHRQYPKAVWLIHTKSGRAFYGQIVATMESFNGDILTITLKTKVVSGHAYPEIPWSSIDFVEYIKENING